MGTLLKLFVGFWIIWLLWYVTGGPLRDDRSKPYIGLNQNGELQTFGKENLPK